MAELDKNKKLYKLAHKLKGEESQVTVVIEELSEEIHMLSKYKRLNEGLLNKKTIIKNLISEAADVVIMMEQLVISFDKENFFNYIKKQKLNRLRKRLDIMLSEAKK